MQLVKRSLGFLLCALVLNPGSLKAAAADSIPTAAMLGSLSSYGTVRVGEIAAAPQAPLFSGDKVVTETGRAVAQYRDGDKISLGANSAVQFSKEQVQLTSGQMSFLAAGVKAPAFLVSSLRLQPEKAGSAANVSLAGSRATVTVTDGIVRVFDPTGASLTSVGKGQSVTLEMASAADPAAPAAPSPAAPSPAPAAGGHGSMWKVVLAGGAVAAVVATGVEMTNNQSSTRDEAIQLQQLLAIPASQRTAAQNSQIAQLTAALQRAGIPVSPSGP